MIAVAVVDRGAPTGDWWVTIVREDSCMFVGPFLTCDQAAEWGGEHGWGPGGKDGGDPRWQVFRLPGGSQPTFVSPELAQVPA